MPIFGRIFFFTSFVFKILFAVLFLVVAFFSGGAYLTKYVDIPKQIIPENCKEFVVKKEEYRKEIEKFKNVEKLFKETFGQKLADKYIKEASGNINMAENKLKVEDNCENYNYLIYFLISFSLFSGFSFAIYQDIRSLRNKK